MGTLAQPEMIVFAAALALMAAIGVIEAMGLGAAGMDTDYGFDLDHGGVLAWLGFGRVPLSVLLIAFLAVFGGLGLAAQQVAAMLTGGFLPAVVAVPGVAVAALPATGLVARGLARVLPRDETTAFEIDDLVGRVGTVTVGRAAAGSPARVRVADPHGQAHHVLVEPNDPAATFEEGDHVRLVRREGDRFRAIVADSPRYSSWMNP